ncbi:MAG TPA: HAD hydrolase-like protein [Yinghuangia sp.]|uniref:HAD family hydrolase n=1 Tax=Yinghuangia sp. YIM S10712 TaxID=3436930 RepID=UPI002CD8753B|nr:HAD hydrolase-like protein [Yinghuangia sp.]
MSMSRARHIVWDWNSTLFHDIDAVLSATNDSFAACGIPAITLDRYRDLYCVPVPKFYEKITGRVPGPDEWAVLDATFQASYAQHAAACALTPGADALLRTWQQTGRTQSLLSLTDHDTLVPYVRRFAIDGLFVRVDGRIGPPGGGKAEHLARHLTALDADPKTVVVIGDAADDAHAARDVGASAVLYTGGSHSRASLERAGVPVVDTLAEAVALAES